MAVRLRWTLTEARLVRWTLDDARRDEMHRLQRARDTFDVVTLKKKRPIARAKAKKMETRITRMGEACRVLEKAIGEAEAKNASRAAGRKRQHGQVR